MRVATLLFYAIATLCLGSIAFEMNGPGMLAWVFGSELDNRWLSAWAAGTLVLSLLFVVWAAMSLRRPNSEE